MMAELKQARIRANTLSIYTYKKKYMYIYMYV